MRESDLYPPFEGLRCPPISSPSQREGEDLREPSIPSQGEGEDLREPDLYPPPPFGRGRIKEGEGFPFIARTIVNNIVKLYTSLS